VALKNKVIADASVANVTVNSVSSDMVITGKQNVTFSLSDLGVVGGLLPVATVTQTSPAPKQIQTIAFNRDFFVGNVFAFTYDSVPLEISFDTNTATTLDKMVTSLKGFASAPLAAIKETSAAPNQETTVTFSKPLFTGCYVTALLTDLGQEIPVQTQINIPFHTSHAVTMTDFAVAIEGLSFVKSATASGNVLNIKTDSSKIQDVADEVLAYGDGSNPVFTLQTINHPIKPLSAIIRCGTVSGTDDGSGLITALGGAISGTISYATGSITISFSTAPAIGTPIRISYMYESSSRTLSVDSVSVSINTVSVDYTTRTIQVITDSEDSLPITASVSGRSVPAMSQSLIQEMIRDDEGSVSSIGGGIKTNMDTLYAYLQKALSDGCRANTVVVSVLSKNADKKYAAPTQSIMDNLWTYLDTRKDIVHYVEVASGIDKVIDVDIAVEVLVDVNAIEDEVVNKIERALLRADASPYGLLVERDFNVSLYVSDVFREIKKYVTDDEIDHLNVVITGPKTHPSGLISDESLAIGVGGLTPLSVSKTLSYSPCVAGAVKIYVDGVIVGEDDGTGLIETVSGAGFTCVGQINYVSSTISLTINPNPPVDKLVTTTYYASKIDARGNYICPKGHVLQAGTVVIRPLPRT
jgi:hypothetical protein